MKKNIIQIIREEISNYFSDWSVDNDEPSIADKYYDKFLGIRQQLSKEPENPIKAKKIGNAKNMFGTGTIPVYYNPENLDGFGKFVRGILVSNGDMYIASDQDTFHEYILDLLSKEGIIPQSIAYDYGNKLPKEFVAVIRTASHNQFIQSDIYETFPDYYRDLFDLANKKHQYKFTVNNFSLKK